MQQQRQVQQQQLLAQQAAQRVGMQSLPTYTMPPLSLPASGTSLDGGMGCVPAPPQPGSGAHPALRASHVQAQQAQQARLAAQQQQTRLLQQQAQQQRRSQSAVPQGVRPIPQSLPMQQQQQQQSALQQPPQQAPQPVSAQQQALPAQQAGPPRNDHVTLQAPCGRQSPQQHTSWRAPQQDGPQPAPLVTLQQGQPSIPPPPATSPGLAAESSGGAGRGLVHGLGSPPDVGTSCTAEVILQPSSSHLHLLAHRAQHLPHSAHLGIGRSADL